jgi:hypothetical protein
MSTVVTEPEVLEQPDSEHDPSVADGALLEDKMPEWFRTPPSFAGFAFLLSVTFVVFNILPLNHTDLWGHLSYGRHIWQTEALPTTEPLMPLSEGISFVDTAWLSQLLGFGAFSLAGKAGLTFLNGLGVALAVGFLVQRIYSRTKSPMLAVTTFFLFMWISWQQLLVIRPQLAGLVFFTATFSCLTRRRWSPVMWAALPAMFALWANMHGSFMVGLGLLACFTMGRAIDVLRRTGKVKALFGDTRLRRFLLVSQLCAVATLLNPYGLAVYPEILTIGQNVNLQDIIEWHPLNLRMFQGQAAAAATLLLFVVYRVSPRRASTGEVLALAVFGIAMLWSSRLIVWWAPLAAYYFAIHAGAILSKWNSPHPQLAHEESEDADENTGRASLWTLVGCFVLFIGFELSHVGGALMDKAFKRDPSKRLEKIAVTSMTPVLATKYLRENPPEGLIFNTYEQGDYLLWAGPPGMKVFLNSHAHLVPEHVWADYMGITRMSSGWSAQLDRYGVNTVVLDFRVRENMIRRLSDDEDWRRVYSDAVAAVFKRKKPI